jgi:hypothetical protein
VTRRERVGGGGRCDRRLVVGAEPEPRRLQRGLRRRSCSAAWRWNAIIAWAIAM